MADTEAPEREGGGSAFGFLGHKIAGKVPVWVVAVAVIGGYYWYTRYGPGKKASASGTTGTDPAGNTGVIDPATGYVAGTPEDLAILQGQATGTSGAGGYQGWQDQQQSGSDTGGGSTGGTPAPTPSPSPVPVTTPPPGQGSGGVGVGNVKPPLPPGVGKIGESTRPQPKPPTRGKATAPVKYTVQKGQTLDEIAAKFHLTPAELAHANVYVAGEASGKAPGTTLGTGAGLKTGQVLTIPQAPQSPSLAKAPKAR